MAEQIYNKTIIFGSAVNWRAPRYEEDWQGANYLVSEASGPKPNDIDVLNVSGEWTPEREERVLWWARVHGLKGVPLDIHTGTKVPTMFGLPERIVVVEDGEAEAWRQEVARREETLDHLSFPAALRAAGRGVMPLEKYLETAGWACKLSLLPASEGEWDKYTQGLQALRSAVRHAPEGWLEHVNCPNLLRRLIGEEPTNWKSGPRWGVRLPNLGQGWSSAYGLVIGRPGDPLYFEDGKEVTEEEAIRIVFG